MRPDDAVLDVADTLTARSNMRTSALQGSRTVTTTKGAKLDVESYLRQAFTVQITRMCGWREQYDVLEVASAAYDAMLDGDLPYELEPEATDEALRANDIGVLRRHIADAAAAYAMRQDDPMDVCGLEYPQRRIA